MRRSEAARYARWSASVALLLALFTAGVYLDRRWTAHLDRRNAPPPAPGGVKERLSHGVTFSKEEGNRRIFTVEASNSTEFKDRDSTVLESVKITIFGNSGERHDVIRTQSCQYARDSGSIECSGEVQMDLQSAADAQRIASDPRSGAPQIVHVATRAVTFDRTKGEAISDQPVTFSFPEGQGRAIGVQYNSDEGTMRLLRNVQFTLTPATASARFGVRSPVNVTGSSMDFDRDSRRLVLHGPAEAKSENANLTAPEMTLNLDAEFHAQTFRAEKTQGQRPKLELRAARSVSELTADTVIAKLASEGWLERVDASGGVRGWHEAEGQRDDFASAAASLQLWPRLTQPREVSLTGAVTVKSQARGTTELRTLRTESLRLEFGGGEPKTPGRLQLAQTLAPGSLEWTEAAGAGAAAGVLTRLKADRLRLEFADTGKASRLAADGNVQTERALAGRPAQTATAGQATAQLEASGGWTQMELHGDVRLEEGERNAQAEHAVFRRAEQSAVLAGSPVLRDVSTQTTAARITFRQGTGEIFAEGGVRSSDISAKGSQAQVDAAPLNITAERMQANSKSGRALYSKQARLWQGQSVMEADSIEIERSRRVLTATHHVRAVFVQMGAKTAARQTAEPQNSKRIAATPASVPGSESKAPNLWHVTADKLTYYDAENRAHLEGQVTAQSAEEKISAPVMELYFARASAATERAAGRAEPAGLELGAQQVSRAVGSGGVTVEEGTRKATAERGEYTAANGQFVMSGGNPTIYDGSAGTTTGRKLTFFLADDTIIVDSPDGSRTLTKHRVE